MIDGEICIAIWINLLAWNTRHQKGASFIFLGIGIARLLDIFR
jgi:ABC-type enterobactin transport system permease subunit